MYQYRLQYCMLEETVYTEDKDRIQDWISTRQERVIYQSVWGNVFLMEPIYVVHVIIALLGVVIVIIILDEDAKEMRLRALYKK